MKAREFWEQGPPWSFMDMLPSERPTYEERRRMRYSLQSYMRSTIRFDRYQGKSVLEVGCGAGIDAAEFARNGALVSACDFTLAAYDATVKTFTEANLRLQALSVCPATELAFDSSSFDMVYCFGVLHHLSPQEMGKAVREARRVLRPGGEYVVMVYNRNSLLYAYSIQHLGLQLERNPGVPHTATFDRETLAYLLEQNGFSDIQIAARYNVIDTPERRKVKLYGLSNSLGLGWHLIARARKPE